MNRASLSPWFVTLLVVATLATTALADPHGLQTLAPELGSCGLDLTARDSDVKPGDDFFRYANGTWLRDFQMPEDLSNYGSFTTLFLRSEEQVKALIEEAAAKGGKKGSGSQKVGDLFNDYLDESQRNESGLSVLERDFRDIDRAESREDIAKLLAQFRRRGGTTPFQFYIDQDAKKPSRYLAHFYQSGLGLPDRDYYLVEDNERFAKARKAYREYLEKMLTLAGRSSPDLHAQAIYDLESRVAQAHWPSEETRDRDRTYNLVRAKDLASSNPAFPWKVYLKGLGLHKEKEFVVMMPDVFEEVGEIFASTPVEVWKEFLVYRLLRNNSSILTTEVDETHFAFSSEAITGSKKQRERWKRGVQFINGSIGEEVGRLYVEKHFSEKAKQRVDELVENVLLAMGERIDGLEWMNEETKVQARDKLSKFVVKIGYPDKWKNYSKLKVESGDLFGNAQRVAEFSYKREVDKLGKPVDRSEWFMSPQTVNAYYNPSMNEIVFPAAILQPPFFDPFADDAVNYGGIGAVIGHEIGHGFDDQGRKSDGDGILRDWWTEADARRFQERADVLVSQYNEFSPLDGMTVNGELMLGENIGDLGGLEIAYHAYKLSLGGKEAPVIDGLTGDQRFFMGYSQIWRGKTRDQLMAVLLASDSHSPMEFRVNGAVRNVDAWYDAFDVGPGDEMYLSPEHRVRIW